MEDCGCIIIAGVLMARAANCRLEHGDEPPTSSLSDAPRTSAIIPHHIQDAVEKLTKKEKKNESD